VFGGESVGSSLRRASIASLAPAAGHDSVHHCCLDLHARVFLPKRRVPRASAPIVKVTAFASIVRLMDAFGGMLQIASDTSTAC